MPWPALHSQLVCERLLPLSPSLLLVLASGALLLAPSIEQPALLESAPLADAPLQDELFLAASPFLSLLQAQLLPGRTAALLHRPGRRKHPHL